MVHITSASCMGVRVVQAAEARAKKQSLMSAGPRKVGGDLSMLKSLTPAQVSSTCSNQALTECCLALS